MLQKIETDPRGLEPYRKWMDDEILCDLERLATRLSGLKVGHVNATARGGGVAEILRSLVPLMNGLGVKTDWYCMGPNPDFFRVTKHIHNSLQGGSWKFDSRTRKTFLLQNRQIATHIDSLDVDLWVVHDPQPCLIRAGLAPSRQAIWHCHIDTSNPNPAVWNYLYRHLQGYDRLVFCLPQYVNGFARSEKVRFLRPAIDPLIPKHQELPKSKVKEILGGLAIDPARPLISQVARFDPWKDPLGVIDAYRIAKQEIPDLQLALVGVIEAQDDPEAEAVLARARDYQGGDPDIHLFSDPEQVGHLEVNAFQTASDVVVQKSLREGFGLTVAEAMWKSTPVIGGNCGGIRVQIEDGKNGYLVNTPAECAQRVVQLIRDASLREGIGTEGKKSVRQNYLIPRLLRDYLTLAEELLLGVAKETGGNGGGADGT
ncbi:MAG: glycosyltransferase [Candidatus Methylomirabilales bacterium]